MKGANVAGVVVAGEVVDTRAHFTGGLVGKGDTENISRQNADLIHQKGKPMDKRPCFSASGTSHDTHKALGGGDGFGLLGI